MSTAASTNTGHSTSWLEVSGDSDFSMYNIPFGVFETEGLSPRCCTALGDYVVDLAVLAEHGYFNPLPVSPQLFHSPFLNGFIAEGREYTGKIRKRLIELFSVGNHELQDRSELHPCIFYKRDAVRMLLPVRIGDYTDFYSSKEHAINVGTLFRGADNALLPNWRHMPVAYHGRASSIVVSGTPVIRPRGQFMKNKNDASPVFGPTQALDYELEIAFVIGKDSIPGEPVRVDEAEQYIFGFLLFNDWSARDIQAWEYVPLGPFLSKNFMSSVSPWIVTADALARFKIDGPVPETPLLPYLQIEGKYNYDIELEIALHAGGIAEVISRTNFRYMYWNVCQQLAHHTVNGCNVRVGDIMASGTISGPTRDGTGSLLELTRNGEEPLQLGDGSARKFLEDGDRVIMRGFAYREGMRVGFGSVEGTITRNTTMELNEVTRRLPRHLLQFVVDQPYNEYTPVDQAVWRYVMRQNYHHLRKVAHESYVEGLQLAGVEIENIPTMYGMNRILQRIGWAAVAVDGFIPPGAFMEFTKYNVLVIAADIRTLEHIEYTPAPDIIHESAGHAPILAMPEFAAYLKAIGEAGSKAFSSRKDVELYEAIRHLSIIKEDPGTSEAEIREAEAAIDAIQKNMGEPSEMALIRNLHWWTVEYGLIGTLDNYKLYGAGLLSSIGEGMSCLSDRVKKLPYTLEAMHCNYDITRPQPQLFVTPDFAHLGKVLGEFRALMAWTTGGMDGVRKAIASEQTATIVLSSGLQVTGTCTHVIEEAGLPVFIQTTGPSALSVDNIQLDAFDKMFFHEGFSTPVGKLLSSTQALEDMPEEILIRHGLEAGRAVGLDFEHGIRVEGIFLEMTRSSSGRNLLMALANATVRHHGKLLVAAASYYMGVGEKIVSAYAGPADVEAFEPTALVPREKMHKIHYDDSDLRLHELYRIVRQARSDDHLINQLPSLWKKLVADFPGDWLLSLEILELLQERRAYQKESNEVVAYLQAKQAADPKLENLIGNGLKVLGMEKLQPAMI